MRLRRQSNAELVDLSRLEPLARGGEAIVFPFPADEGAVVKIYHRPMESHRQKLRAMLNNPPADPMAARGHVSIAWPQDMLYSDDQHAIMMGYVMHRIRGMRPIIDYFNPSSRRRLCPLFNYKYLLYAARNLVAAVKSVHERGYVIGDINESNVLAADTALITLVDTDSFQVHDPASGLMFRCPVGKAEYTPPELQNRVFAEVDRAREHDLFALAVLLFSLLMEGTHPFDGIYDGPDNPPLREERIAAGHFPYGSRPGPYRPKPSAPPFEILAPPLRALFLRCFDQGHDDPTARPTAAEWQMALHQAEQGLIVCRDNGQHLYGAHLTACPWCARTALLGGRDPFPSVREVREAKQETSAKVDTLIGMGTVLPPSNELLPKEERAGFAFKFMLVNVAAAFATYVGMRVGSVATTDDYHTDGWAARLLAGLVGAAALGIVQALFLRKHLAPKQLGLWIGCTVAAGLIASFLDPTGGLHGVGFLLGLCSIAGQSFVLSDRFKNWGLWPAAGVPSIILAVIVQEAIVKGTGNRPLFTLEMTYGLLQGVFGGFALANLERK